MSQNPTKQQFQYDPMYRLVKATGRELTALAMPSATDFANNIPIPNPGNNVMQNYTEYFTYDQIGNITLHDHYTTGQSPNWSKEYCYDDINTNNYLSKHDANQTLPDYTYDAHGNITTMPHLPSIQWDYKDQLREVELNLSGDTAYYIYDNTGNRVRKVIEKGSIREERYYAGGYEVFRKFVSGDLDFERQTLHVDDDKSKVALIETKTVENGSTLTTPEITIRYQYSNHLGTACLELDDTADIISYEEYHPFGTTSYRSGRNQVDVSLKRFKYVGKERDEETGLYYYGARYYADWLCRFVSVDPLQFKYPDLTPFQYASNRPITMIDLDGLEGTRLDYNNMPEAEPYKNRGQKAATKTGGIAGALKAKAAVAKTTSSSNASAGLTVNQALPKTDYTVTGTLNPQDGIVTNHTTQTIPNTSTTNTTSSPQICTDRLQPGGNTYTWNLPNNNVQTTTTPSMPASSGILYATPSNYQQWVNDQYPGGYSVPPDPYESTAKNDLVFKASALATIPVGSGVTVPSASYVLASGGSAVTAIKVATAGYVGWRTPPTLNLDLGDPITNISYQSFNLLHEAIENLVQEGSLKTTDVTMTGGAIGNNSLTNPMTTPDTNGFQYQWSDPQVEEVKPMNITY